MFKLNDTILYGTHGACRIAGVTTKDFSGRPVDYYELKPVYNEKSTIYVPVGNQALEDKMRRILSPEEIYEIIQCIPDEEADWIENEDERKERYRQILSGGNRIELVKIIKALYLHQREQQAKGRRLHASDERFFKDAEKMLYDEFALVLNIKPEQVLPFIMEQIQIEKKEGR